MRIIVLGLTLSSSWGNGHATTYRALLRALGARGHDILFLERTMPWYAARRDLVAPDYCRLELYESLSDLSRFAKPVRDATAVIIGSYVPDGKAVIDWALATARGTVAFYDIDTPITLRQIADETCAYLARQQIPRLALYLSFADGPTLETLTRDLGAQAAKALYCSVDPEIYTPRPGAKEWDLGYLGTYSPDRQPGLEAMLLDVARRAPAMRFVVAGAQYPASMVWPANVTHIEHLPPGRHAAFYTSQRWTLNLTRADMRNAGYSPSVRLFEAASCATPVISDSWPGLETFFEPGREIVIADSTDKVLATLGLSSARSAKYGAAARAKILSQHTAQHRARELEHMLLEAHNAERRSATVGNAFE